jgi:hypothetical protein
MCLEQKFSAITRVDIVLDDNFVDVDTLVHVHWAHVHMPNTVLFLS